MPPPPVVVFKGNNVPNDDLYHPHHGGHGQPHSGYGHRDPLDSPPHRGGGRSDYLPYRDARTLTWDRNPKPDRSDPKYFPVNSLPRQNHNHHRGPPGGGGDPAAMDPGAPGPPPVVDGYPGPRPDGGDPMMGPHPPPRGLGGGGDPGMPPPMRELNTGYGDGGGGPPPREPRYGNGNGGNGGDYYGNESDSGIDSRPGRGTRLLHRMAADPGRYGGLRGGGGYGTHHRQQYSNHLSASVAAHRSAQQYPGGGGVGDPARLEYASDTDALHSPAGSSIVGGPVVGAAAPGSHRRMNGNVSSSSIVSRSSSLPRTFQREALLRHPELSMELDRLITDPAVALAASATAAGLSTDDQMSDSGAISAPESVITAARKRGMYELCTSGCGACSRNPSIARIKFFVSIYLLYNNMLYVGYRSPSSFSAIDSYAMNHLRSTAAHHSSRSGGRHSSLGLAPDYGGYGKSSSLIHRTPSTSAIYETLRRSKELRESINSRPSSRMSLRDTVRRMHQ